MFNPYYSCVALLSDDTCMVHMAENRILSVPTPLTLNSVEVRDIKPLFTEN